MIPTLPYDIWFLIAKYIPEDTLLTLYSVNSALFDIVMNDAYEHVYLHHSMNGCRRPCLGGPLDPLLPERAKRLDICPSIHRDPRTPEPVQTRKPGKIRRIMNRLNPPEKKKIKARQREIAACQTELQQCIERMVQLKTLTLEYTPSLRLDAFNSAIPLFSTAWSAHGSRITSLSLYIPIEAYSTVIPATLSFICLKDLDIAVSLVYPTTAYEETLVFIAGFIARHALTLTSLRIEITSPLIHPLHLFNNIPKLPSLTELYLAIWVERLRPQYYTKIDQFLQRQAKSLTTMTFRFFGPNNTYDLPPLPDVFFSNPLFQVKLPCLHTIYMNLCKWGEELNNPVKDNFVTYLRRIQNVESLKKLAIGCYMFSLVQVKDIVALYSTGTSQLQSFQIQTYYLSCSLLDLLSSQLPRLRDLQLYFDELMSNEDEWDTHAWPDVETQTAIFLDDMALRNYSDWELRYLTIDSPRCKFESWEKCKPLLTAALPRVITFNDLSREEFLQPPDASKPI